MSWLSTWTSSKQTSTSPLSSTKNSMSAQVSAGSLRLFSSNWSTPWSSGIAQRPWSMIWLILARRGPATRPSTSRSAARATMLRSSWSRKPTETRRQTRLWLAPWTRSPSSTVTLRLARQATKLRVTTPPCFLRRWHTKTSSITSLKHILRPSNESWNAWISWNSCCQNRKVNNC